MSFVLANRVIFILAIIGLAVSGYLFYTYVFNSPIVCVNTGCETVRVSPYSHFFGVPLPFFGGLMYLGIFIFSFTATFVAENFVKKIEYAIFFLSGVGVAVSIYLTYLEIFVIRAICVWCLAQAFVILTIFMLISCRLWKTKHEA